MRRENAMGTRRTAPSHDRTPPRASGPQVQGLLATDAVLHDLGSLGLITLPALGPASQER